MTEEREPTPGRQPAAARLWIVACVVLAGAIVLGLPALVNEPRPQPLLLVLLGAGCCASGLVEVFAPDSHALQPNLILFLWAAVLMPPWALLVLAALCFGLGPVLGRVPWYKASFNAANYVIAGTVAHLLVGSGALAAGGPGLEPLAQLFGVALVFVLVNHALLGVMIALAHSRPLERTLTALKNDLPPDLAMALTGVCLAVLWRDAPALSLLAVGPMVLIYRGLSVPLLRHRTRTDPKTGLFNSSFFGESLAEALTAARREGTAVSLAMIDLDHLRVINNRYGHLAGDEVIRQLSSLLAQDAAGRDVAARFGGEEFCLLLPGADARAARDHVERIRARLEASGFAWAHDGHARVTLSAGVASFPEHGERAEDLLEAADIALYDAKAGGRNRVRIALTAHARAVLKIDAGVGQTGPEAAPHEPASGPVPASANGNGSHASLAPPSSADLPRGPAADPGSAASAASPAPRGTIFDIPEQPLPPEEEPPASEGTPTHPATPARGRLISGVVALLVLAVIATALLIEPDSIRSSPTTFLLLVGLIVAMELVRVDLFERANVSAAAVPTLALAFLYGPLGPVVSESVIALLRAVRREPVVKWTFDLGALGVSGAVAGLVYELIAPHGGIAVLGSAVAGGLAYYVVNATTLTTVMALSEGVRPRQIWRERLAWLWTHYVVWGALAGGVLLTEQQIGAYALLVFAAPILVVWVTEKQYIDRSRASVERLRESNEQTQLANRQLRALLESNQELLRSMRRSYLSTITSLARTIEAKDPYTGGHTDRVARLTCLLASDLGMSDSEIEAVEFGGVIHDIGKIGIPDAILLKPGRLEPEEFAEMRRHPEISSYILADLELPLAVKQMARSHHERFDGKGYPDGLVGEEIPLAARALSVADALDAMTSDRPYRSALTLDVAIDEISKQTGSQFCPRVVDALMAHLRIDPTLAGMYPEQIESLAPAGPADDARPASLVTAVPASA